MAECNFCTLKRMKKEAKAVGYKVVKVWRTEQVLGAADTCRGVDIFIVPGTIKNAFVGNHCNIKRFRDKYWRVWFPELGGKCEC